MHIIEDTCKKKAQTHPSTPWLYNPVFLSPHFNMELYRTDSDFLLNYSIFQPG